MSGYIIGFHAIEEALKFSGRGGILYLAKRGKRYDVLAHAAAECGAKVVDVPEHELTRLCGNSEHRGVLFQPASREAGKHRDLAEFLASDREGPQLVVVLDEITDPHNLGAVLRTCDQFGVDLVVIPQRRSAKETQTVVKTSSGAALYVPVVIVPNIPRALDLLKERGFWVYGADMEGTALPNARFDVKSVLVMGSEGKGLGRLIREHCDMLVSIPSKGHVDSLNVSVAAGICMYEIRRFQGMFNL